jgi:aspartate carbamoyltransferase catalytic subunit
MSDVQFPNFANQIDRPTTAKVQDFQRQGRLKHIIFGQQLTTQLLEKLCRSADTIRTMAKDPNGNAQLRNLLADKRAMLYFTQPSTRTFLSFII